MNNSISAVPFFIKNSFILLVLVSADKLDISLRILGFS